MNPLCLSHRLNFPSGHLAHDVLKAVNEAQEYLSAEGQFRAKDVNCVSLAEVVSQLVACGLASGQDFTQLMSESLLTTHTRVIRQVNDVLEEMAGRYQLNNMNMRWDFSRKILTIDTMPDAYILAPATSPIGQLQRYVISLVDGIFCVSDKAIIHSGLRGQIIGEVSDLINADNFNPLMALSSIKEAFHGDSSLEELDEDERIDIVSFAIDEFVLDANYDDSLETVSESLVAEIRRIIESSQKPTLTLDMFESMDFGEQRKLASKLIGFAQELIKNNDQLTKVAERLLDIVGDAQAFCYGAYFISEEFVDLAEKDINYIYETGETCALECELCHDALNELDYFLSLYRSFLSLFIDE